MSDFGIPKINSGAGDPAALITTIASTQPLVGVNPREGERWLIQYPNALALCKVTVLERTARAVRLNEHERTCAVDQWFCVDDLRWVERLSFGELRK